MNAPLRLARLFAVCGGLLAVRSLAQDVTVSEAMWALPEPAPDQIPKPKSRLRPDFPSEMRGTAEPGYVMITRYVDSDGKSLSLHAAGTHAPFQRAVEAEVHDWTMSAGKRDGKPVGGEVWIAAIFNPKSATTKGPNATPRLLAVVPIVIPKFPGAKDGSAVVRVRLQLDATGAVVSSTPEAEITPSAADTLAEALQQWQFAPARQNGQPVAAELVLPVVCQTPTRAQTSNYVPPRLIKREPADYPMAMRASRMRGEVTIAFDVDVDGTVKNPVVTSSNNPGFDDAALASVRGAKFQPGTRDGKPVKARLSLPIHFNISSNRPGFVARDAYDIQESFHRSKLPPELRYDTPAKVRGTAVPVYPYALQRDRVRGSASLALVIDANGHVVETKVIETTHPEFGLATQAATETFAFDPALRDAKAVPSVLRFAQDFTYSKPADSDPDDLMSVEKNHPERIINAAKLDAPVNPISRKAPVFPLALAGKVHSGTAVVEFLIDREGHVRLPRVVSATEEALGYSAVQAASVWVFDPPKMGGKRVTTRVQVPFTFNGPRVAEKKDGNAETPPEK